MNFHPVVELVGAPFFTKINFDPVQIQLGEKPYYSDSTKKLILFNVKSPSPIFLEMTFKLTNSGNYIGKIRNHITTFSIKDDFDLRESLLDETDEIMVKEYLKYSPFMKNELLPEGKDTIDITLNSGIEQLRKYQKFVLHFILIYENELGNLYDIYYKSKYELNLTIPNPFKDERFLRGEGISFRLYKKNVFQIKKYKTTHYTYNLSESEYIKDYFDSWKNKNN